MREAAKQYGVSDVALKKVCRKLNVPTPPQGHLLRVAAGRDVVRATLAPLGADEAGVIVTNRWQDHDPIVPSTRAASQKARAAIVVAPTLDDPHRLVARAAKLLAKAKPSDPSGYALSLCLCARCRGSMQRRFNSRQPDFVMYRCGKWGR